MKGYLKLAMFLAVLLFSVGLMSVAIDILGDISEVEFNTGTRLVPGVETGTEKGEEELRKTQAVQVEGGSVGEGRVLLEIVYAPGTRYLRTTVGAGYENGTWEPVEAGGWEPYNSGELEPEPRDSAFEQRFYFTVRPIGMMSGNIPGTLYTIRVGGLEELEYNKHLELFNSIEPFNRTYGIEHETYRFTDRTFSSTEVTPFTDYLEVPEEMKENLEDLAQDIVEGASNPYEELKAIENYLKTNYDYNASYERAPNGTDPVEWFLFEEEKGLCTQFNSAFVLLARSLGIPVRPVAGYLIEPDASYQLVLGRDAHLWAEVHFEGLGWVTFDATPPLEEEVQPKVRTFKTVTNITYNDPVALKGGTFQVHGTVTLENGTGISDLTVEIFLSLKKNETDAASGSGVVQNGFFNITSDAAPEMAVGDYNLIAHTLPGGVYEESWSDPPIRIMADTNVSIQAPTWAYVGDRVSIHGTLLDKSNGQPVPNATLTIKVGDEIRNLRTDDEGNIRLSHTFEDEGNATVELALEDSDYYLGSESSFGIAVRIPPTPKPSVFMIITTFPYNLIIFAGFAIVIGSVLVLTRKQESIEISQKVEEVEEEMPRDYEDYKDGIVKLFNWFYARSKRRLEGINDSLTPREFQDAVLPGIPEKGQPALEYLVTAFEIADYSASNPSQEMYEKSLAAVELLGGMIERGA
jgi:transglutaminase-like putative cysteine protease